MTFVRKEKKNGGKGTNDIIYQDGDMFLNQAIQFEIYTEKSGMENFNNQFIYFNVLFESIFF